MTRKPGISNRELKPDSLANDGADTGGGPGVVGISNRELKLLTAM